MRTKAFTFSIAIAVAVLSSRVASAEVPIGNAGDWEFFAQGRVNAFFSYAFGDGNPVPPAGVNESIVNGGGLNVAKDSMTSPLGVQAKFANMRLRSGFLPNVFGVGMRRQLTEHTKLTTYMSLWATIDTEGQRKTQQLFAWVQEWYLRLDGPWGSLLAGRALDLFSRGATLNDFLYLHGYSLGFPGNVEANPNGPSNGLIGFGVLAAFFSAGITYATPSQFPVQNTIGVYDPTPLPGGYEATRYPRIEDELTYDLATQSFKLHLFANGEWQQVYKGGLNDHANSYGVGYGGRAELGNFHLGVAGHWGKGLGLFFALEPDDVSVSSTTFELRTFDGYSAIGQYVAGPFDINVGWGISRVFLLPSDAFTPDGTMAPSTVSVLKNQMAYAVALVYHARNYLHFSIDYLRMDAKWYGAPAVLAMGFPAEKQDVNFISTGVTATW